MVINGQKWAKMVINGSKVIQSHSKWSKKGQKWSKRVKTGRLGSIRQEKWKETRMALNLNKNGQNGQKGSKHSKKREKNAKNHVFRNGGQKIDKTGPLGCIRKGKWKETRMALNLNKKPINLLKSAKKMKIWSMRKTMVFIKKGQKGVKKSDKID